MSLDWGREVCGNLSVAESREWLCTNGIGGFASGTVAEVLTRRYHGLLVAAPKPPPGRTVLVAKLEETLECGGMTRQLVYGDSEAARAFLAPMAHHLADYGVGSLAETFDGDPPFTPRGCIAQAWSVSETLRAWVASPQGDAGTAPDAPSA